MSMIDKIDQMIDGVDAWLKSVDYHYIECNYVPEYLDSGNDRLNAFIRTIFRLLPFDIRKFDIEKVPYTPQTTVALLKAYAIVNDVNAIAELYNRSIKLRSQKTKYFALKQGIKISTRLYENTTEDPTPLNTVWFGQFLLDEHSGMISSLEKKQILLSITKYLIYELGYVDHHDKGIYFYYGPTLKKEIYNASAIISAFLIKVGNLYNDKDLINIGQRGIKFIVNKQNNDGSWFYAGSPERPTIDCFHQSYILQALFSVQEDLDFDIEATLKSGVSFYKNMFVVKNRYLQPIRYDKRYTPRNTWLFVDVDGRDVAEALVLFSKYLDDIDTINSLINYLYDEFYIKDKGYFYPEKFIYGKNRIPYAEFQAWFLYSLYVVKKHFLL